MPALRVSKILGCLQFCKAEQLSNFHGLKFTLLDGSECEAHFHICVSCAEARRGHHSSWNRSCSHVSAGNGTPVLPVFSQHHTEMLSHLSRPVARIPQAEINKIKQ